MRPLVLVCAHDLDFYLLLKHILEADGFATCFADTHEEAIRAAKADAPRAVVLDCRAASDETVQICSSLKGDEATAQIPLVALIGAGAERQHIQLLKAGLDESLMRPITPKRLLEFLRRVVVADASNGTPSEAAARRSLRFGDIEVTPETFLVSCNNREVHLGPIEFKLLLHFLNSPDRVFTRDELISAIWPKSTNVDTRTVDVHIGYLRRAMESIAKDRVIRTVRSVGYALNQSGERERSGFR